MSKNEAQDTIAFYIERLQTDTTELFNLIKDIHPELAFATGPSLRRAQTALNTVNKGAQMFLNEKGSNIL